MIANFLQEKKCEQILNLFKLVLIVMNDNKNFSYLTQTNKLMNAIKQSFFVTLFQIFINK
jgi:hypothetical protein